MNIHGKLLAISDDIDTCTGLRLAEVSSHPAYTPDELRHILENIEPDVGIVIVTEGLAAKCADMLEKYRQDTPMPLVTIIPDPRSTVL